MLLLFCCHVVVLLSCCCGVVMLLSCSCVVVVLLSSCCVVVVVLSCCCHVVVLLSCSERVCVSIQKTVPSANQQRKFQPALFIVSCVCVLVGWVWEVIVMHIRPEISTTTHQYTHVVHT